MKDDKDGLENKLNEKRLGHHAIYASLEILFLGGAIAAGVSTQHLKEYAAMLTVICGYSGMLAGLTGVWWYNDFSSYRKSKPL